MNYFAGVIQVNSVTPGHIGGAVFSGRVTGERRIRVCKANYKILTRAPQPGECWNVIGWETKLEDYKTYVTVTECHIVNLPAAAYVEQLLIKHPAFRGMYFGKAKVQKLMREFSAENLVQTLNSGRTAHIAEVVSPQIAEEVVKKWQSLQNEIATAEFLMEHNFEPDLAKKIIKVCRTDTVERLKQNPFGLIAFRGLHKNLWNALEATGRKLGIAKDDPRRLVGAVEHVLYERLSDGHTACPVSECINLVSRTLDDRSIAKHAIQCALDRKAICTTEIDGEKLIQPLGAAIIEGQLESRIRALLAGQLSIFSGSPRSIKASIEQYEEAAINTSGYSLTDEQKSAVSMALLNRVSIITGYGGTGKTTVLRAVSEIALSQHRPVRLLALSGKAKERAREATGIDAYTIHGLIQAIQKEISSISASGDPLIIIDEASMVDISLMNKLLRLFDKNSFSLLMVGDTGQISPVGFGLFWHKLAKDKLVPITNLTKVHRTAEEGDLHKIAMQIREGQLPELRTWDGEDQGVYIVPCYPTGKALAGKLHEIKTQLPDAQIITPHMSARMADSGHSINERLQYSLNESFEKPGIKMGSYWIKVGDPVIVTQNSYEHDLYNGNTGVMEDLREEEGQLYGVFSFGGREYLFTRSDLWTLGIQLAYAMTIHKSQGSEYDTTIICSVAQTNFIERSMIYTALTRSRKLCLIVGDQNIARMAVAKPNRSDTLCVGFKI
nr:AAA family ATPase [uncultured Marinobacter sp.]